MTGVGLHRARRDADLHLRAACRALRNSAAALREAGEPEVAERILRFAVEVEREVAVVAALAEASR